MKSLRVDGKKTDNLLFLDKISTGIKFSFGKHEKHILRQLVLQRFEHGPRLIKLACFPLFSPIDVRY